MNRYTLIARLGAGSMGEVWRATRRLSDGTDQDVAIKFVHEKWQDERDALERFQLEGRVGLDLHHTNIVDVYDLDSIDGRPCIVMELIEGVSLEQLAADCTMPHGMVRLILRDALAGLRHAHDCDVLHRDLSPGNIMIGRNGIARLTDFGMAKNLRGPQTVGMLMGTLVYLAPEVLQVQEWSPGTDVYSLGAVFYWTLAGRAPYEAEDRRGLLDAMRSRSLDPLPRSVPRDVREFIYAALNLAPDRIVEAMVAADELAATEDDEAQRKQLGAMVAGLLDDSATLEHAQTIPLCVTRKAAEASLEAEADADADTLRDAPRPEPRKRRVLALALAAAVLLAGLAISRQVSDGDHQTAPPRVIRETPPPVPMEPIPVRVDNPPDSEPAEPPARGRARPSNLRDHFFPE